MRPKEFCFSACCNGRFSACCDNTKEERFKVKVYFENISKTFITSSKPLIINNEAIAINSDNGNEYYYKLSMINGYEIEKYSTSNPW